MGIYDLDHFARKEDALEYYAIRMTKFLDETVANLYIGNKELARKNLKITNILVNKYLETLDALIMEL